MKLAMGHNSPDTYVVLDKSESEYLIKGLTTIQPYERPKILAALDEWEGRFSDDRGLVIKFTEYVQLIRMR